MKLKGVKLKITDKPDKLKMKYKGTKTTI
uniref:Uncharacterized protein n=1 Tax=Rhizophora mucronata TaxID=61149 RepID=A0A2P2QPC5_RHIMU